MAAVAVLVHMVLQGIDAQRPGMPSDDEWCVMKCETGRWENLGDADCLEYVTCMKEKCNKDVASTHKCDRKCQPLDDADEYCDKKVYNGKPPANLHADAKCQEYKTCYNKECKEMADIQCDGDDSGNGGNGIKIGNDGIGVGGVHIKSDSGATPLTMDMMLILLPVSVLALCMGAKM